MMQRIYPMLLVLWMIGIAIVPETSAQESQTCFRATDYVELINLALSKGEYEEALQYVACIERYFPNSAYTFMFEAIVYESMGDYEAMLDSARKSVLKDNYNGFAHLIQARAHLNLEDYPACIQSGESAMLFGVQEFGTFDILMRCYHMTDQFEQSADMASQIIEIKFNTILADAYFYRAYAYYELERIDDAYADIQEAIREYDASFGSAFVVQSYILFELGDYLGAYASLERGRLLGDVSYSMIEDMYARLWDVLKIDEPTVMNDNFMSETGDIYAQRARALEAIVIADYELASDQLEGLNQLDYGDYVQQYQHAMLAYVALLSNDFTKRVQYSNFFADSANLRGIARFKELPTEPIIIPTGFWTGGVYRFTVRPNQTYTFTAEAIDDARVVDPYIVILQGVNQMVVMGVGDDAEIDGRVEYTFATDTPGQYVIFVGGFGLAYGDIRLSYTETR